MAFEMTHLRFAMDLAPRLDIKDSPSYLAGTIYPDSRYVTGIQRNLTHGQGVPEDPFVTGLDDFHKGWATHILYDQEGIQKYKDLSPWPERKIVGFSEEWIFTTAVKLVEDFLSYDAMAVPREMVEGLTPPTPLNQEDPGLLASYYQDNKTIYQNRPTFDDYRRIMHGWHIEEKIIDQLIAKTEELQKDKGMVEKISRIYPEILAQIQSR
ncbi:MAG: hypothetical protein PHC53_05000 [Patescibacteria group bacterium]|nr:hypothetical protein [Patescibacteria group bacterium]